MFASVFESCATSASGSSLQDNGAHSSSSTTSVMEPEETKKNKYKMPCNLRPVQTYVFVDLETSGLDYPRITELSMLALSRNDFLSMETRSVKNVGKSFFKKLANSCDFNEIIDHTDVFENPTNLDAKLVNLNSAKRRLFTTPIPKRKNDCDKLPKSNKIPRIDPIVTDMPCISHESYLQRCNRYQLPTLPRIVHRSTKLFNPRSIIYPAPEEVSGLNNMMLEHVPIISQEYCQSFKEFLNLPKPVCLIGHNADRCDFPTIIAEFIFATDCQFDCEDILCADSLTILKLLDKIEIFEEIQESTDLVSKDLEWFLSEDIFGDNSRNNDTVPGSEIYEAEPYNVAPSTPARAQGPFDSNGSPLYVRVGNSTPIQVGVQRAPETPVTPSSQSFLCSSSSASLLHASMATPPTTPSSSSSRTNNHIQAPTRSASPFKLDKTLINYPRNCSFKSKVMITRKHEGYNLGLSYKQSPFSQPTLYERLFGCKYNCHRAEADCTALLQISGHYGVKFADTVDVVRRPLRLVAPKWIRTKTLRNKNYEKYWLN